MKSWSKLLVSAAVVLVAAVASADSGIEGLLGQLHDQDARVRMRAALELGKADGRQAREALEGALTDAEASVRLASVTALERLGDPGALKTLAAHEDASEPVRRKVAEAISALESLEQARREARILVQLGRMNNGTEIAADSAVRYLRAQVRQQLSELPGIAVIEADADVEGRPLVMLAGRVVSLSARRQGDRVLYSAKVEFIVHTMPAQAITAAVSGRAAAEADLSEARSKRRAAEIRASVLEGAIRGAMRNVMPALEAAADR